MVLTRSSVSSADRIEDPYDVYRIRLPRRSRAQIRLRPGFGNPNLFIFRGSARSINENENIVARSRKTGQATDAVTIRNPGRSARRFYVAIDLGEAGTGLNASYSLVFQRLKYR